VVVEMVADSQAQQTQAEAVVVAPLEMVRALREVLA
jgi:hypothetical protein